MEVELKTSSPCLLNEFYQMIDHSILDELNYQFKDGCKAQGWTGGVNFAKV